MTKKLVSRAHAFTRIYNVQKWGVKQNVSIKNKEEDWNDNKTTKQKNLSLFHFFGRRKMEAG
jgi:hypothetical protein